LELEGGGFRSEFVRIELAEPETRNPKGNRYEGL
jgi:hypothetical protein